MRPESVPGTQVQSGSAEMKGPSSAHNNSSPTIQPMHRRSHTNTHRKLVNTVRFLLAQAVFWAEAQKCRPKCKLTMQKNLRPLISDGSVGPNKNPGLLILRLWVSV